MRALPMLEFPMLEFPMLEFHLQLGDTSPRVERCAAPVTLGRAPRCGLQVRSLRVAREHVRFIHTASGPALQDLGSLTGTRVNGERVAAFGPLTPEDAVQIGPCTLRVRLCEAESVCAPPGRVGPAASVVPPAGAGRAEPRLADLLGVDAETLGQRAAQTSAQNPAPQPSAVSGPLDTTPAPNSAAAIDPVLRQRLHAALLDALDLRRRDVASMSDAALRREAEVRLGELIARDATIAPAVDRAALLRQVVDEAVGLGPLEPLLADDTVTEIMVNRYDQIYVEIDGRLHRHATGFSSEQAVLGAIERIVAPLGRRIDESSPMVDARLRDGSRVNAVIAPVALKGAGLTIRKFARNRRSMAELVAAGTLNAVMAQFLALCVRHKKNLVVAGGTGSGKTTLLNALAAAIPEGERVVTVEDAAELRLAHANLVALEARSANLQGRGGITIRDLVRNALRMRPDRIVVGECRGGEAFDMLAAMNSGHEGSLTTLHANGPRDALARLETMILMAGMDLPLAAIREHVAAGIDLIVQLARRTDGHRRVTAVVEVSGIEGNRILLQELFRFGDGDAHAERFVGAGVTPTFFDDWRAAGVPVSPHWFAAPPGV